MKYFSLFTGVGGFEQGIPEDWECIGFSETDKYCNMVLKYHYPNIKNYGDINEIKWNQISDFDVCVGGSPCQDLSIAGRHKGIHAKRSRLFFQYIKCLNEKKPNYFIWENVAGSLSSNGGFDFGRVLLEFSKQGYSLWWQILNAKNFGVPQNRERIFIIGSRKAGFPEVFFKPKEYRQNNGRIGEEISFAIDSNYFKGTNTTKKSRRQLVEVVSEDRTKIEAYSIPLKYLGRNQKNFPSEYAMTLDVAQTNGLMVGNKIRKLTPLECERLMGFDDEWTKYGINENGDKIEISDTQRYKMCGNGVVTNIIKELVQLIK